MARTPNDRLDDTDLRVDVGVIKSQLTDLKMVVTSMNKKLDNMSYIDKHTYAEDRKTDAAEYATKEELKPIKNMFYAILTTIVVGLITAFMTFVIKGGIQ